MTATIWLFERVTFLASYQGPEQLDALDVRRELLVKYFDEQIARRGDAAVLYDLPPRP